MKLTPSDEQFMKSALAIAACGIGSVEPNPAVGAVIVKGGRMIGKGYHKKFGSPHAEINALADCVKKGNNPEGATMYVTLEPCSHFGKTGPCTKAIRDAKIAKVIIATVDPSPYASGKGIEELKIAGINVELGLCEQDAQLLNAPFFKFVRTGRPWVILKWAQSIDGKLAYAHPAPGHRWISNDASRADVHRLRRRVQAILAGINTIIMDNPVLTPRPPRNKNPLRIVLDTNLRIPPDSAVLQTARKHPLLIGASRDAVIRHDDITTSIAKRGAEVLPCPARDGKIDLNALLTELGKRQIQQLLVEGGPQVHASFLKQNLADEIIIYIAPKILGAEGLASINDFTTILTKELHLQNVSIRVFGDDVCVSGLVKNS